ncbi:uncharacterized protein LOC102063027 isoform X1 [Zonotrichia albicollis]|uniref:uncharacterized protein LOC102063027 isoform X1 n=1 Tax=Zonotrichia albicollis TaxID=44394 RepID=UPI003D80B209
MLQQCPSPPPTPGCLLPPPLPGAADSVPVPQHPRLGFPRCSKASPPGARAGPEPGPRTPGAKAGSNRSLWSWSPRSRGQREPSGAPARDVTASTAMLPEATAQDIPSKTGSYQNMGSSRGPHHLLSVGLVPQHLNQLVPGFLDGNQISADFNLSR